MLVNEVTTKDKAQYPCQDLSLSQYEKSLTSWLSLSVWVDKNTILYLALSSSGI